MVASHRRQPQVHPDAFVHPAAVVMGDVVIAEHASVWPGASLRGDLERITIGPSSNVQDNCVIHTTQGGAPTTLGSFVSLGHGAVVHSATIGDDVLIGMRATVLDDCVVGAGSLVAAGAVLSPGTVVPENSLVMGVPGKVVKQDEALRARCHENAVHYLEYLRWHRRGDYPTWRPSMPK
jgi:carbonic anhydrase/acetyltransferase-like protein (isoleucine patch superfamily)